MGALIVRSVRATVCTALATTPKASPPKHIVDSVAGRGGTGDRDMSETHDGAADRRQPRRWRVLDAVTSVATPATVDEITDQLHARRAPSDPLAGLESWDRTHQRLHEVDLPALSAAGLLEFDRERGIVTVPPEAAESGFGPANVEATHERRGDDGAGTVGTATSSATVAAGDEDAPAARSDAVAADESAAAVGTALPWHHLYLGATVVSATLIVGSMEAVPTGVGYPSTLAAAIAVALFGGLAIGHQVSIAR